MLTNATAKRISPASVKAMLTDGEELALVDVREELIYSQNHLLWARSIPLSRLELKFARLVPRKSTRIVLVDENDGLAERAAAILSRHGYSGLHILDGGIAGWATAGYELFSGVNVPSKAFGEFVEHASGTPSVSADELNAMIRERADIVVLDSRPFDEFNRVSIPTGINVPGAELVLRVHDIAPSRGDHGGGQLRRPHPQHHRRAVADQCRHPEQGGGAAQRHHGLDARRLHARSRQDPGRAEAVARNPRLGEIARRRGCAPLQHRANRPGHAGALPRRSRHAHALCLRRARSGRIRRRPFSRRGVGAGRPARAGDRPICRQRSAPASCSATTPRCAR